MITKPIINNAFIKEWAAKYDSSEHDEQEYANLRIDVPNSILKTGNLPSGLFLRIYNWKAPRARNNVYWKQFDSIYSPRFKLVFSNLIQTNHKLAVLLWKKEKLEKKLPIENDNIFGSFSSKASGIGIPIASTILHFAYPNDFPIADIRLAETLYILSYTQSAKINYVWYKNFRDKMCCIASNENCSLRDIDMAMFSFHKLIVQAAIDNIPLDAPGSIRKACIDRLKVGFK